MKVRILPQTDGTKLFRKEIDNMKKWILLALLLILPSVQAAEFYSLKFDFWVGEISTATVGETIRLPIYVKNLGALEDNYTISVTSTSPSIYIQDQSLLISSLKNNEIRSTFSRMTLTVGGSDANVVVTVSSATRPTYSQTKTLTIKGGLANLPDFDYLGIVQIMIISTAVFALVFRRN